MAWEKELDVAKTLAAKAGELQLEYLKKSKRIEIKGDDSPVTEVDQACEALIRKGLLEAFPDDGLLGEEEGHQEGASGRTWIIDPIDGTRPYIKGLPTFSCLIGLEQDNDVKVGVIHLPAMNEMLWAARGEGAFCNGEPIHVSDIPTLDKAMGTAMGFIQKKGPQPHGDALFELLKKWDYTYGFMDAYTYAAIAQGKIDACVNIWDKPWDRAPAIVIIEEAGGRYSNLNGKSDVYEGETVVTNGKFHDEVLAHFESFEG